MTLPCKQSEMDAGPVSDHARSIVRRETPVATRDLGKISFGVHPKLFNASLINTLIRRWLLHMVYNQDFTPCFSAALA